MNTRRTVMSVRRTQGTRRTLSILLVALLVGALLPAVAITVTPVDLYVDQATGSDTTGDGSAGNPYKTITKALSVSGIGTITVGPGTYEYHTETFPLDLGSGMSLVGAGAGETIIDAGGTGRVVQTYNSNVGQTIQGVTITGGNANGGGLFIFNHGAGNVGWPYVVACEITSNTVGSNIGNGVWIEGAGPAATPLFEDCTISNNVSNIGGGVAVLAQGDPVFVGCTVDGNEASSGAGGGFFVGDVSSLTLIDCDVTWNSASSMGGGIAFTSATKALAVLGGGIGRNSADEGGGAYVVDGDAHFESVEVYGNQSFTGMGGGLITGSSASADIVDCALWGNVAGSGGTAIAVGSGSPVTLSHVSVFNNGNGPAVRENSASMDVYNSIFWGNGGDDFFSHPFLIQESCVQEGGITGTGVISTDPQMVHPDGGDYRLRLGSPCIDEAGSAGGDSDDINGDTRPQNGDGTGGAQPDMGCWERPPAVIARQSGDTRYDTACQMARDAFDSADTAVLACGEDFPDALSAAGLAGAHDAPLLLTDPDAVPSAVTAALSDLGVQDVIIVGGKAVVSDAVKQALADAGYDVTRIAGANRFDTSARVARAIERELGACFSGTAFFARGDTFPDALAAAPLAYAGAHPVLLVEPDSVPGEIASAITALDIQEGYVCGGTSAVEGPTKSAIDAKLVANGGSATERWTGDDRYDTAAQIADEGVDAGFATWGYVGIATGENFPDALAGGMLAGAQGGVVLLTDTDSLPSSTRGLLQDFDYAIDTCEIYGGPSAVSDAVRDAVDTALGW